MLRSATDKMQFANISAEYVNHMGDDIMVVNAARVSMDKESDWHIEYDDDDDIFGTCSLKDADQRLIKYLAKHNHWTPFSHPQITLRETVPIFVARQRFKHMVGFTYNEVSRRYVDDEPSFYRPDVWRERAENVKQGSLDVPVVSNLLLGREYERLMKTCLDHYTTMLVDGVAPEQARMVLPQSMMTSYYVTGSLAAFARAYKQRIDPHAQKEVRDLAVRWDETIRPLYPASWSALVD